MLIGSQQKLRIRNNAINSEKKKKNLLKNCVKIMPDTKHSSKLSRQ